MSLDASKVTARHLKRDAYLYVRQSTVRQVFENTESTKRQYALRRRAVALGWHAGQVIVIDSDLGQSGASCARREGFKRLVAEVGMGHAGIVLGLEVSRLARNSTDWHRLLEICAVTDTLILDEDGIYDPAHFNDRLLLGLKGTMSEAELHIMRARLRGGLINKARRGELRCILPVGLVYDTEGQVILDPDRQVQDAVRLLFQTFQRTGVARQVVRHFREEKLLFPRRMHCGPHKGEIIWRELLLKQTVSVLHNPRYAGAYVFGRHRFRTLPDGRSRREILPRDEWIAFIKDAHPGYITWDEHEWIEQRLRSSAKAYGAEGRHGPPREGPALLQGRAICGVCGLRMAVRYHRRGEDLVPDYQCVIKTIQTGDSPCQVIPGASVDAAIGKLLVESMTPMALEVALAVWQEIQDRQEEADRLRLQQVERAQYEADLARRRYMQVDPSNRLVADSLEAAWNDKLRALTESREHYDQQKRADEATGKSIDRQRVLSLVKDFPAIWNDPQTPQRERKRMVGLLIENVTLVKRDEINAHVRFRGGATTTLTLPLPLNAWQGRMTSPHVVAQVDELLQQHTDAEVARLLNERGAETGAGAPFSPAAVKWVRCSHGLQSLKQRLMAAGWLTTTEYAVKSGVHYGTVKVWLRDGLLTGRASNDAGHWLLDPKQKPPKRARSGRKPRSIQAHPEQHAATVAGGAV
ncbi:MAG: recombinase family protein [bacterium]|nr:recombinase family protein [bacterium]